MLSSIETSKMTSREIAELTEKRHDNVIQLTRKLEIDQILTPEFQEVEYRGRMIPIAIFDKRDSLVLVARLSPEFTAAVIDRWQQLESNQSLLPTDYESALEHLLCQVKENKALESKIKEDKPKVEFVDKYVDLAGSYCLRDAAKILGVAPQLFNRKLVVDKFLYRDNSGILTPISRHLQKGYFSVKTSHHDGLRKQTRVTAKGVEYFARRYSEDKQVAEVRH